MKGKEEIPNQTGNNKFGKTAENTVFAAYPFKGQLIILLIDMYDQFRCTKQ